jgi:UDP-2,4-diacetamido-2,4,6-trideoxy-beta-L-altropyranose hydrolase
MSLSLVIRADANTQIGTGHLMRCLALAQGWQALGGQVVFVTACDSKTLQQRLEDEGFDVVPLGQAYPNPVDWDITSQVLATHPDAWLVLDGYHFDAAYQRRAKGAGHRLLVIDDLAHLEHYYADVILNQNINAERLTYSREAYTRLLQGMGYVLLRTEFLAWQGWQREIPEVGSKILITLGGGDQHNQTLKIIRVLQRLEIKGLHIVVAIGASNPHRVALEAAVAGSRMDIDLRENVTNMPELMAWADVAISAGGSTCWELAFMGLPSIVLVLAPNQQSVAQELSEAGFTLNLGEYNQAVDTKLADSVKELVCDPACRRKMSEAGQTLVDGYGAARVVSSLLEIEQSFSLSDHLRARDADFRDARLLWQWANDPSVRANSFHPEAIPLDEHLNWYKRKLASPGTRIWILELNQVPVAQIRYDRIDANEAEISFSVSSMDRGKGLGTRALILTAEMACRELGVRYLRGAVFDANLASARTFIKAGFRHVGQEQISNTLCNIFVWGCSDANGEILG